MLYFLTSRPLWLSAMIIIGLGTSLSMLGPGLVRRRIRLERLTENNEIAGFKYAALGVLYAVLLAFAIIVVWQKFGDAETTVSQEAGAAATIYRLSQGLDVTTGAAVRDALSAYLERAIADDWSVMERGLPGAKSARQALDTLYAALLGSKSVAGGDNAVVSEILHQLDIITQSRRARLDVAEGVVPGVIWVVLLGGAVVTVGFTFFFGTTNLRAQIMMAGLLALMIFSELWIIIAIDRPFTGPVKVNPTALADVLADFGTGTRGANGGTEQRP